MVISSAGLYNTFQKLLPPNISENSYFHGICKNLKPAYAAMNVFLGFDASNEELGLKAQSIWAFTTNDSGKNLTTPDLPDLPDLPDMPDLPDLPDIPDIPDLPDLPNLSDLPNLPNVPNLKYLPNLPNLPNLPGPVRTSLTL